MQGSGPGLDLRPVPFRDVLAVNANDPIPKLEARLPGSGWDAVTMTRSRVLVDRGGAPSSSRRFFPTPRPRHLDHQGANRAAVRGTGHVGHRWDRTVGTGAHGSSASGLSRRCKRGAHQFGPTRHRDLGRWRRGFGGIGRTVDRRAVWAERVWPWRLVWGGLDGSVQAEMLEAGYNARGGWGDLAIS